MRRAEVRSLQGWIGYVIYLPAYSISKDSPRNPLYQPLSWCHTPGSSQ